MAEKFTTFREFYPYYLSEHTHPVCRTLHFVGSIVALVMLATALASRNPWWLVGVPLSGYAFAWVGHFFFEHNRPATFTYPVFSLAGDWVMFWQLLTRKIPFSSTAR